MARPPKSTFLQLPSNARSIWDTRPDVRMALDQLEMGVLKNAAQLADQMMGDDRIRGVLGTRVDALTSSPVEVKPASKKVKAGKVARELGGYEDDDGFEVGGGWEDMFPAEVVGRLSHWGLMVGIGVAQKRWVTTDGKWTPRLVPWHPQFIRWDWSTNSFKLQTANRGEIELPRLDDGAQLAADSEWVVWCPFGYREGWMWSLVRWLADKYIMRQWSYRDWQRYCEAHGQPVTVAYVPANAKQEDKDAYYEELVDAHGERVIMIPVGEGGREAGWGAGVIEPTARTYDSFRLLLEALGVDIAIGILGQNLTTQVSEGSLASTSQHMEVKLDKARFDAKIANVLRSQVIVPWAKYNYGDPALAPKPKYCVEPAADETEEANTMKTAGEAAQVLKEVTPKFDVATFLERFGVPLLTDEELAASDQTALESIQLTPSVQGAIVTVNEARSGQGLGPLASKDGVQDPDGYLTITDYLQKHVPDQATQMRGGIEGAAAPPTAADQKAQIDEAARTNPDATKKQLQLRAVVPPPVKRRTFAGLPIAIENPAGTHRVWVDEHQNETGRTLMLHDYGYIEGVMGSDKDELDCYLGPDEGAAKVHVVHQLRGPSYKTHDEDKVMLGWHSADEAERAYLAHRNDGNRALGGISSIPLERFKAKLQRRKGAGRITAGAGFTRRGVALALARADLTSEDVAAFGVTFGPARAAAGSGPGILTLARGMLDRGEDMQLAARARGPRAAARSKLYGDRVADKALRIAAHALAPELAAYREEIAAATSLPDLRARILKRYKGMNPAKLARVMEVARTMAYFGGRDSAARAAKIIR